MNLRRSQALRVLFASSAAAAAFPHVAAAQTPRTLRLVLIPGATGATADFADKLGMFRRAGIEVEINKVSNGAAAAAAVAGGAMDIGFSNPLSIAQGHTRGLPFSILLPGAMAIAGKETNAFVVVAKNSSIQTGKDFEGKTIAVDVLAGLPYASVQAWVDGNGGDSKAVHFVELPAAEMMGALTSGRVDGAEMNDAFDPKMGKPGDPLRVLGNSYSIVAPRFASSVWFSTTDWIAKNREIAETFVKVMKDAATWANGHPRESAPLLSAYIKQSVAAIDASTRVTYGVEMTPNLVQPVIDIGVKYRLLRSGFPAADIISDVASA